MNKIFKAERRHAPRIYDYIKRNMTRALPMLQGIDEKSMLVVEGYSFYIYGCEINAGFFINGLAMYAPSGSMYIHTDDAGMFEKLEFFRLVRRMSPRTVRAERSVSVHMEALLKNTKVGFSKHGLLLMKSSLDALEQKSLEAPAGVISVVSDEERIDDVMGFIMETEKEFNKNSSPSKSDIKNFVAVKMRSGNYVIAEANGQGVAQGLIEFCKSGIGLIGNVYTTPSHRGKGYAKFVVTRLMGICRNRISIPFLFVESENLPALKLYEGLGFKRISEWTMLELYEKAI